MPRIVAATSNAGKLIELRQLLPTDVQVIGLHEAGLPSPVETGTTFAENALLKARAAVHGGDLALADDSGLEVDALGGAPGVLSARYAGEPADDRRNNERLLGELAQAAAEGRHARFRSVVALVSADGREWIAEGVIEGIIGSEVRGSNGFGYDPLFVICDADAIQFNGRTMAELTLVEKNAISHRARAYSALREPLSAVLDELDITGGAHE